MPKRRSAIWKASLAGQSRYTRPVVDAAHDHQVRMAAFDFLEVQTSRHGDVLPWAVLTKEFHLNGRAVPLLGAAGIWKPAILDLPISITTSPSGPYQDRMRPDGMLEYAYRRGGPEAPDNVRLREAFRQNVPLIYFYGVAKGEYIATWPVLIVTDDPASLQILIAVEEPQIIAPDLPDTVAVEAKRAYYTTAARRRLHQAAFRHRVLRAYRERCTVCRLRRAELLDAAHIMPDSSPLGEPVVSNGLALCKIHHAAFDRHIMGIRPDHLIEIRGDVLAEVDGPMLEHGLQKFQGQAIEVPRAAADRPRPDFLAERFEQFQEAG